MRSRPAHRIAFGVAAASMTLALNACGSSDSASSGSTAAKSTATASAAAASSAGLDAAAKQFASFVGGTAGKADASKPPVVLGFVNDEGGVPSFPEGSPAAEAAVKLVNEKLGGIGGAPVQLKKCLVATGEEQGQACAQQFSNDKSMVGVVEDVLTVGAGAFHKALAGSKAVIIGSPNTPDDGAAKNVLPISAGVFGTSPGFVSYAVGTLKAKTASLLFPGDDPTGQIAAKQIADGLRKGGIKVTQAGYKSTAPSMLAPATAAGAGRTDVTITLFPTPPTCLAGAKALQSSTQGKPVLSLGQCLADPVKKALGDYPKWTYISLSENPFLPAASPDVKAYAETMKAYAPADANLGGFAQEAFSAVLTAVKAGNAAGATPTVASFSKAVAAITGPTPMHPPTLKPGIIPGLPSLTSLQTRLYTYDGDDKFTDATGGKWVP